MDGTGLQPGQLDHATSYGSLGSPHGLSGANDDQDDKKTQVREEWSEGATDAVLEIWGEKHLAINRGKLKKHEWDEVAERVSIRLGGGKSTKTWLQCKNKIDSIKKKYKIVRNQKNAGVLKKDWRLYDKVDELLGPWQRQSSGNGLNGDGRMEDSDGGDDDGDDGADDEAYDVAARQQYEVRHNIIPSPIPETDMKNTHPVTFGMPAVGIPSAKPSKKRKAEASSMNDLAKAIREFAVVYERVEILKQDKLMQLEDRRQLFAKELELQKIQYQMEVARMAGAKQMPGSSMFGQE